jgi:hypothetical protein
MTNNMILPKALDQQTQGRESLNSQRFISYSPPVAGDIDWESLRSFWYPYILDFFHTEFAWMLSRED